MKTLFKNLKVGETFYCKTFLSEPEVIPGKGRIDVLAWEKFSKISGSQAKCIDVSTSWENRRAVNSTRTFTSNSTVLLSLEKMDFNTFWDWLQFASPQAKIHFEMINKILRYTTPSAPEDYVRKHYNEYLAN